MYKKEYAFSVVLLYINKIPWFLLDSLIKFDGKKYVSHSYDKGGQYMWGWYSDSQIILKIRNSV